MRLRNAWVGLAGIALAVNVVACGGGQETSSKSAEPSSPSGAPAGQKVDTATAGDVKGVVTLDGAPPKNEAIKMNADPVCVKQKPRARSCRRPTWSATTASARQRVRLREGRPRQLRLRHADRDRRRSIRRSAATIRTCSACASTSRSRSSTAIRRCTTSTRCRRRNSEFNNGQPIQGMKMTHTFDKKEVMVPFKCDVHGWMNAYVGVLDHPVLRGDRQERQVRDEGAAAGHLHDRSVAREARHPDRERDARRRRNRRTSPSRSSRRARPRRTKQSA